MGRQLTNAASPTGDDTDLAGLRRGLGQAGTPIPAYRTLGVEVRRAAGGSAVVRVPVSPHLMAPDGGLLPGAFAVLADACCGCAVATALPAGGAALTAQLRVEFIRPLRPAKSGSRAGRRPTPSTTTAAWLAARSWTRRTSCSAWPRCASSRHHIRASGRPPPNPSPATPRPRQTQPTQTQPTQTQPTQTQPTQDQPN